jgi:hypothetical protein
VVGAIHPLLERDVVAGGPRAEPARGQHEVHVDALEIHVVDALGGLVVHARMRLARAVRAGEARHVLAAGVLRIGRAEAAAIVPLPLGIDRVAAVGRRLVLLPRRQLGFLRLGEVLLEDIEIGADVRVGVENLEAVLGHAVSCFNL